MKEYFKCEIVAPLESVHSLRVKLELYAMPTVSTNPSTIDVAADISGEWAAETTISGGGIKGAILKLEAPLAPEIYVRAGTGAYQNLSYGRTVSYTLGDRPNFTFTGRLSFRGLRSKIGGPYVYNIRLTLTQP